MLLLLAVEGWWWPVLLLLLEGQHWALLWLLLLLFPACQIPLVAPSRKLKQLRPRLCSILTCTR
jgi:hypothetical protein